MSSNKKVVHIGCFLDIPGGKSGPKVEPGVEYLCFEIGDRFKEAIVQEYEQISPTYKEQVKLIFQSARNTNLPESSIDEIHMYNVLGDPKVTKSEELLTEANRILKPQKAIYIGETITPYAIEDLIIMSRKTNFSMELIVPHPTEHLTEQEIKRFHEIIEENKSSEAYNKNFHEWYDLLHKTKLLKEPFSKPYRLNDSEKKTITNYRGNENWICIDSYLVKFIKK
jgi:ubiquinone/menaquinone biosynthesis C-methylase UbiE